VTAGAAAPAALYIAPAAACPLCQQPATRVHSPYHRTLADLPCLDYAVRLDIQVRRFRCRTIQCPRWIFSERLSGFVQP
jgi:transposase